MRIIKPSKRPRNGQLSSQASPQEDAFNFTTDQFNSNFSSESNTSSSELKENSHAPKVNDELSLNKAKEGVAGGKENSNLEAVSSEQKQFNHLFSKGIRLLAMREHSVKEITDKLSAKSGDVMDIVYAVVDELIENNYLSDERFTESYVRSRAGRGFGPVKIRAELRNKGVSSYMADDHLDENASVWFDNAAAQHHKKYGAVAPSDYNEWSKRARFLQGRGFAMTHIQLALPKVDFD